MEFFLAQADGAPNPFIQFLPFILLIAAFWFLLIAPQRKKQKEHARMISELKTGDKVVTSGGIFGTISGVRPDRFQIKVDDNTRIDVLKSFVQSRQGDETPNK
ncbi:MAG: preprotein translocase subunit YajC [Opitutales bacterium]|nr:preprotein translocase subunit YajC [Opitutales bacterium]